MLQRDAEGILNRWGRKTWRKLRAHVLCWTVDCLQQLPKTKEITWELDSG